MLFIALLFCPYIIWGQSTSIPFHYRIGQEEFGNIDVYNLHFDEANELLYAATNDGVFYYAHSRFQRIATDDRAIGSSYFNFQENSLGELFCMNLQGQVFKVTKKKVELFFQFPKKYYAGNFDYIVDRNDDFACIGRSLVKFEYKVDTVGTPQVLMDGTDVVTNVLHDARGKYVLAIDLASLERVTIPESSKQHVTKTRGRYVMNIGGQLLGVEPGRQTNVGSFTFYNDDYSEQLKINHDDVQQVYRYYDDSTIAVVNRKSGIKFLRKRGEEIVTALELFDNEFISAVEQSGSGVGFLGTFKEGVIVIPDIRFQGNTSSSLLTSIRPYDDQNYVVSKRNGEVLGVSYLDHAEQVVAKHGINVDKLFVGSYRSNQDYWSRIFLYPDQSSNGAADLGNGDVVFVSWNGLRLAKMRPDLSKLPDIDHGGFSKVLAFGEKIRYNLVQADSLRRKVYASTSGNLYVMNFSDGTPVEIKHKGSIKTTAMLFKEGKLFCGTTDGAILIFEDEEFIDRIDLPESISERTIKRLGIKFNRLFILTDSGIRVFNIDNREYEGFGIAANLMGNDITDFSLASNHLLVLRRKEHYSIPYESFNELTTPSKIYVDSLLVNEKREAFWKKSFGYDENSFRFFVDYRDPRTVSKTKISYILDGFYDDWKTLKSGEHEIEFQSLPVGDYTLRIQAEFQGQFTDTFEYEFSISPPYWQRWWFYVLIVVLAAIIIWILAITRIRRIRLKSSQRLEVETSKRVAVNAQLKAIRAQMNPHFVFNAINSIQDLVLQQETIKSYDYLESFSRLVRLTLEHSEREFVTLNEEVSFLELYLELESLRFDKDFSYKIQVKDELKNQVIPSLIVQPFVENAIKHGLLHLEVEKSLIVDFSLHHNGFVRCEITDNGVGRERAEQIGQRQDRQHDSFSTKAIENRMKMLTEQFGSNCGYFIEDLMNKKGEAQGTRVVIDLPLIRSGVHE